MKTIKYIGLGLIMAASFSACNPNRNSATLGNTQDTTNAVAGSDAGGTTPAQGADTSKNGNKNNSADTASKGNVNPTGHHQSDTANPNKSNKPK